MPQPPRRYQRSDHRLAVDVRVATWGEFARLYTKDISCGGLFVEADNPPDVFSAVEVTLHLPDGAGTVALGAKVVHAVPADCKPPGAVAGMGLQFTRISEEQQAKLAGWFERAHGRATTTPPGAEPPGHASVPSITESELPVVLPESVQQMLEAKLGSLVGNAFELLNTPRETNAEQLRRQYLGLAKKYHPQRWAHYEDAEITALARKIGDILARAYEQAKGELEGRSESRISTSGARRVRVDPRYRQTHAELSDFADGVCEVKPTPKDAPVDLQVSQSLKLLALKRYDKARQALGEVLEQAPEHKAAQIWIRVAEARQRKQAGDTAGAVAVYREILDELDPAHGEALKEVRASGGRISNLFKKITGR